MPKLKEALAITWPLEHWAEFCFCFLKNTLLSTSEQYISLIILLYDTTLQNKKEAYLIIVTYTTN